MSKLTMVELKLFLREPPAVFFVFALPLALVAVFGMIPGMNEPAPEFGGHSPMAALIAPVSVGIALAILALTMLPTLLATYRERGVLRRMGTTPVHPANVLSAQLVVLGVAAIVAGGLIVGVGAAVFGIPVPGRPLWFVASFVLGALSLFAVGLVIAAVARTERAAQACGFLLLFPSMFLAGVYVPSEKLPPTLQHIGAATPLGAAVHALRASWAGDPPRPLHLVIMAAYAVVAGLVAARLFRWE